MTESRKSHEEYDLVVKILAVKMKIKFPCKMKLEHEGEFITGESSANEQLKFVFNQDIEMKGENEESSFDIMINLITDKGTKYVSGTLKLLAKELIRSQGQRVIVAIAKCLDQNAFCQLKVEQVKSSKKKASVKIIKRLSSYADNSQILNQVNQTNHETKKLDLEKILIGETRSEVNYSIPVRPFNFEENKVKQKGPLSQIYKTFAKSPKSKLEEVKFTSLRSAQKMHTEYGDGKNNHALFQDYDGNISQKEKYAESEVYKEGYQKLKDKFKKEAELAKTETNKRLELEANQNTYKLEIMKLKLKIEEQEKLINDKNQKLKLFSQNASELQKKELDYNFLKEEISSFQYKQKLNEENISALNKDNELLKKIIKDRYNVEQETNKEMRNEIEALKSKLDENKFQYQLKFKNKADMLQTKISELQTKTEIIERQKKTIRQLEKAAEQKLFEFQKTLSHEKSNMSLKIAEMKLSIEQAISEKKEKTKQAENLEDRIKELTTNTNSLDYTIKVLQENICSYSKESEEFKILKEKYADLMNQHKQLADQSSKLRNTLELSLENKQIVLKEVMNAMEVSIKKKDQKNKQNEAIIKLHRNKILELEGLVEHQRLEAEKIKKRQEIKIREHQILNKENIELNSELKSYRRRLAEFEEEHFNHQHSSEKQSIQFAKINEKLHEEKTKLDHEITALTRNLQACEEVIKNKEEKQREVEIKLRCLEEKMEKQTKGLKDHVNKLEEMNSEKDQTIQYLEKQIQIHAHTISNKNMNLHELEIKLINFNTNLSVSQKELKVLEERNRYFQVQLKNKLQEFFKIEAILKEKQIKFAEAESEISELKHKSKLFQTTCENQVRIIAHHKKEAQKAGTNEELLKSQIKMKELQIDQQTEINKAQKEEKIKVEMKLQNIQKQYERFKSHIQDIIKLEFNSITNVNQQGNHLKGSTQIRQSQISSPRSPRSHRNYDSQTNLHKLQKESPGKEKSTSQVGSHSDSNKISLILIEKLRETKTTIFKLQEHSKRLRIENLDLIEQSESQENRNQFKALELNRDMQALEEELNQVIESKEEECINYDSLLNDLNHKLKERESQIEDLKCEIDEFQRIINSMRIDFEVNNESNEKKCISLRSIVKEHEQKILFINHQLEEFQDKNRDLQAYIDDLQTKNKELNQLNEKGEKFLFQLTQINHLLESETEIQKKNLKASNQKAMELELQYSTIIEEKEKYVEYLKDEENKSNNYKQFISQLINAKENLIKQEIDRIEEHNALENNHLELKEKFSFLQEEKIIFLKNIEEFKNSLKVLTTSEKSLNHEITELRSKMNKKEEKHKEKEHELHLTREELRSVEEKYAELKSKMIQSMVDLNEQIEGKSVYGEELKKELTIRITAIENDNRKYAEDHFKFKAIIEEKENLLQEQNHSIHFLQNQVEMLKQEKNEFQNELEANNIIILQKATRIEQLLEDLNKANQSIYFLEHKCSTLQSEFEEKSNQFKEQYDFKIQSLTLEFTSKMEIINRDKYNLEIHWKDQEEEIYKLELKNKDYEIRVQMAKKQQEEQLKKYQNQKINYIVTKNNQIKKNSQDNKKLQEKIKQIDVQLRSKVNQLQIQRQERNKLEREKNRAGEDFKNKEKLLHLQIEGLKEHEREYKMLKGKVMESVHRNEGEVRKIIANLTKKAIDSCDSTHSEKLILLMKSLEGLVVQAMQKNLNLLE